MSPPTLAWEWLPLSCYVHACTAASLFNIPAQGEWSTKCCLSHSSKGKRSASERRVGRRSRQQAKMVLRDETVTLLVGTPSTASWVASQPGSASQQRSMGRCFHPYSAHLPASPHRRIGFEGLWSCCFHSKGVRKECWKKCESVYKMLLKGYLLMPTQFLFLASAF